jgi:hypothetical protein
VVRAAMQRELDRLGCVDPYSQPAVDQVCRWRRMRRDLQSVVGHVPTSFQYEDQDEHKCALHALNN